MKEKTTKERLRRMEKHMEMLKRVEQTLEQLSMGLNLVNGTVFAMREDMEEHLNELREIRDQHELEMVESEEYAYPLIGEAPDDPVFVDTSSPPQTSASMKELMDSGFFDEEVVNTLEDQAEKYVINEEDDEDIPF